MEDDAKKTEADKKAEQGTDDNDKGECEAKQLKDDTIFDIVTVTDDFARADDFAKEQKVKQEEAAKIELELRRAKIDQPPFCR